MPEFNKFFGEPGNHAFGPAVQPRGNTFGKRGDLGNSQEGSSFKTDKSLFSR